MLKRLLDQVMRGGGTRGGYGRRGGYGNRGGGSTGARIGSMVERYLRSRRR
ncbi:MAG TPA: hypothetical protein VK304_01925 [Thermoleophilaceae bacterium]|nr:hypothetical protein [Thermoleophilaceae bacterium]